MFLNLEKIISGSHDFLKFKSRGRSFVKTVPRQQRGWHTGHAGRKSYETFTVLSQEFLVDAGLVIEAFRKCFRREPGKIVVAFEVLCEQDQMKVRLLSRR